MSIKRPISMIEEERTYRANIVTPYGSDYLIQIFRETMIREAGGRVFGPARQSEIPVQRFAKNIAEESVILPGGEVVEAATILAALPLFFDRWATEDAQTRG